MLRTKMTELFGIQHPIMLAGMNWITEPKLVSAVCNAGGLGILAIARCNPKETRENIKQVRDMTDKPFGINQILIGPGAKENIAVAIEEKVPIINYSLGKPWFVNDVHAYGGKVMGTIAIAKHATKAVQLGCDALVVTGHEAAAHGAAATSMVLIPIVASMVKVPLIAAGGFYDGRGLAAALALGADGISMGSRFMLVKESMVHENFKKLCLEATEQDTLYSNVFDGMDGRVLKTKEAEAMMKKGFPLIEAFKGALLVKKLMNLSFAKFLGVSIEMLRAEEGHPLWVLARQAVGNMKHLKALNEGDVQGGILFAGQCCGGIADIPSTKELIDRVITEAEATLAKLSTYNA
ncbi:MAG TPA: nitronate monooxygenase [Smithellaceae bacterium]|jgi:enoyl-[acyl-carrier protein] reductase II|nr:nitronate monooxygenase [Smithellaceae bacterium]HNV64088.1 nitronate monooxygenase [Smithellaceae bacterium]HOD30419.1 nitronate monooxygenase [Smithellaceae bacterium]HOF77461.1 nitronate monooxygenase [Smithellaceae bacterium]HOM69253.1 nitronate monooxygenase [Smithellaceae bacterium]